jgi:hypothetical protein
LSGLRYFLRLHWPARTTLPCCTVAPLIFSIDGIHDIRNCNRKKLKKKNVEWRLRGRDTALCDDQDAFSIMIRAKLR